MCAAVNSATEIPMKQYSIFVSIIADKNSLVNTFLEQKFAFFYKSFLHLKTLF
jgi:hypothetical protein